MKTYTENDVVTLSCPAAGTAIGEEIEVILPAGTMATVVLVHGNPEQPLAYEIEAYLVDKDCYVLATVQGNNIAHK